MPSESNHANGSSPRAETLQRFRTLLHRTAASPANLPRVLKLTPEELQAELAVVLARLCGEQGVVFSADDQQILAGEVVHQIVGYGPLEPLMRDPEVSDILVNDYRRVCVERGGVLYRTDVEFPDEESLLTFITRLVERAGRRIDAAQPMVDVQLPDGSRLNAVLRPLSLRGPTVAIRRRRPDVIHTEELTAAGALTAEMAEFLTRAVEGRANLIISGGTGAGKTTLLNALSRFIPHSERTITIEQTAELQLQQPDVIALEARPPNIEGKGEVPVRDLFKNALRMRPDRIIVGECRGGEVFDVLQAMMTGHDGSMSTIHASDAREALQRMELMIALGGVELPSPTAREFIAAAVDLIVHVKRLGTGERKVTQIAELNGMHDGAFRLDDLFVYEQRGIDPGRGRVVGDFRATGFRPRFLERLRPLGVVYSEEAFAARVLPSGRAIS